jgi:hypothetical protein
MVRLRVTFIACLCFAGGSIPALHTQSQRTDVGANPSFAIDGVIASQRSSRRKGGERPNYVAMNGGQME